MAGFRLEGMEELLKDIEKYAKPESIKKVVQKNGADLTRNMKRNAVFTRGYATGETQRSIELEMKDGGLTAEVGPRTDYSIYLEYGTRFMAAQPFVRKSLEGIKDAYIDDLNELLR